MTDVLLTLAGFAILVGLFLVPAFQRGRWVWLVAIIVLTPIGGFVWILTQRAVDGAGMTAPERPL